MRNSLAYSRVSEKEEQGTGHQYRITYGKQTVAQVSRTKNGFEGQTIGAMKKRNLRERTMAGIKAQLQALIDGDKRPFWKALRAT